MQEALRQAQSVAYLGIFIMQIFNMFICKGRYRLPFGTFIFKNKFTWAAIFGGACVAMFIVYVPPMRCTLLSS